MEAFTVPFRVLSRKKYEGDIWQSTLRVEVIRNICLFCYYNIMKVSVYVFVELAPLRADINFKPCLQNGILVPLKGSFQDSDGHLHPCYYGSPFPCWAPISKPAPTRARA